MLKAIELSGFKSFADKTRLEFPAGVTVVVGPNGSGKSNVVDAIKWVLGSQSAKSLRGKEMTDVIFNGSGSRGPLHTAEVTLTLDNSERLLDVDSPEVHVTRRVYRSGEGEYLVNRQPCRLRDIRDLLAGTGIATEAYCIIEQGKVDVLLQSSPRDRRMIFEEAAGISRFKAKRAEAARRLERVEQNLLRLSDLVDEVESRLRSVRMQAGKARKYRDYADRLEELRTAVGLEDWHRLSTRAEKLATQTNQLRQQCAAQQQAIAAGEGQLAEWETRIDTVGLALRQIETEDGADREQIAAQRAAARTGFARLDELTEEQARHRRQIAAMSTRVENASQQVREAHIRLGEARQAQHAAAHELAAATGNLERGEATLVEARADAEQLVAAHREATNTVADLASKLQVLASQQTTFEAARAQSQQSLSEMCERHTSLSAELSQQRAHQEWIAAEVASAAARLHEARQLVAQRRRDMSRARKKLGQLASQRAGLAERIAVLDELEQRREGYESGVKQVLEQAHQEPAGPLGEICGSVAELFQVDIDTAPLIEVAIGERAQHLVVRSGARILDWLGQRPSAVSGRVGFLRLDVRSAASAVDRIDLSSEAGVLGRADSFVQTTPELADLARRLLGRTWLVDSLGTAVRLAGSVGRGLSFVSSDGELLAADGTVVVGPRSVSTGLLTRASELRSSRDQVHELDRQMLVQQKQVERLETELAEVEERALEQLTDHTGLTKDLTAIERVTSGLECKVAAVADKRAQVEGELAGLESQFCTLDDELRAARDQMERVRGDAAELDARHRDTASQLPELTRQAEQLRSAATTAQVAAARSEQRVEILEGQYAQMQRDQEERAQALIEVGERLEASRKQCLAVEQAILTAIQAVASVALRRERLSESLRVQSSEFNELRKQRATLAQQLQHNRKRLTTLQGELSRLEVAAGKLDHEQQALCERLRDDYGIDLREAAHGNVPSRPIADRSAVDAEIADLRTKLNSIGAVNLDSLEELDELESRFERLSGHYRDLVDAKATLERIIQRINVDSRKLFVATLDSVRGHFKELFRRLFGGGEADLILEQDADDVLESGIEIVACPPGKDTRTISLLSGGEKTLTCVALLLAVFRSKPSPFCVLDEVDAALDEANIGRFTGVLGEFLSSTQFIVITHSKKTMSGGNTLYGVTMQESGISKLVSVRFEDVSEDGHILPSAIKQNAGNLPPVEARPAA